MCLQNLSYIILCIKLDSSQWNMIVIKRVIRQFTWMMYFILNTIFNNYFCYLLIILYWYVKEFPDWRTSLHQSMHLKQLSISYTPSQQRWSWMYVMTCWIFLSLSSLWDNKGQELSLEFSFLHCREYCVTYWCKRVSGVRE